MKQAVMYGGGNIGRGFIGATLSQSGYEVTFIDVAEPVVKALQEKKQYPVRYVSSEGHEDVTIEHVTAVNGNDQEAASEAIANCDIMATAVGARILKFIVGNIVAGLRKRWARDDRPLNIIICENLMDANKVMEGMLKDLLTDEEKKRAFEPFARLANADVQEGFGLGLNITKELTEMLGGQLKMDSKKGEGTTFRITLPLPLASGIKEDMPELRTTDLPKNLRVIAVDDDKVILNLIKKQMEYAGVHCDICRNPSEMVELLREGHYDLLLTDIRMPGMNGYELLELLRNSNVGNSKEIPVLVITAHVPRKKEELVEAGFDSCLYKPFAREELYAAVNTALERGKERNSNAETDEIDFSPLLIKEDDGKEMLHILREQTQKDMEVLADIVERQDMDALTDMVHHLLPVWTMLRIDDCLLELRRVYKMEDAEWTEIEAVTNKVQVQGKELVEQAGRKEEAYGKE